MERKISKLAIKKETLRELDSKQLQHAAGGKNLSDILYCPTDPCIPHSEWRTCWCVDR